MTNLITPTEADRCLHCGQPEYAHVRVTGAGRICPVSCFTFRSERDYLAAARLEGAKAMQEACAEKLRQTLRKWPEGIFAAQNIESLDPNKVPEGR